jgi:hypothetical protein
MRLRDGSGQNGGQCDGDIGVGDKVACAGFPKKALSTEEPSEPMHQNYRFPAALTNILRLSPKTDIGPSSPSPFPEKNTVHDMLAEIADRDSNSSK